MEFYQTINLHSHTYRCHHAQGTVEHYAKEALRKDLKVLGISDHTPFPEKRDEGVRMELEELPAYLREIEEARQRHPELTILKGLECDYAEDLLPFYKKLKEEHPLDYLIGSVHFFYENQTMKSVFEEPIDHKRLRLYTEQMLGNIDSEIFAFLAHPDLFCMRLEAWDSYTEDCVREMCAFAEQKKRVFEINVNGRHRPGKPYPEEKFWKIVSDYDIETVINSDAHKIEYLCAEKEYGYELQQKYGLRQSRLFAPENEQETYR